ncbi:MAG: hypothetical protein R2762_20910 [Bryobacteraceae bacterium]
MDLQKTINELMEEKRRIEQAIDCLEAVFAGRPAGAQRGRKGMNEEERLQVSERMRRYWAEQRRNKPKG